MSELQAGEDLIALLENDLKSQSMLIRHDAAQKLTGIGGPRVEKIFQRLVQKNGIEYKRIGLVGLATVAPEQNESVFAEYLNHESMQIRWACVIGLGRTANAKWIPVLKQMAKTDSGFIRSQNRYPVRDAAAEAVKKIETSPYWLFSYDEAVEAAKKERRNIVLFWRLPSEKWSIKMNEESFSSEGFLPIKNKYVWLQLDALESSDLADQLQVKQVPLVQLINPDGQELERWTGYYGADILAKDLKSIFQGVPSTFEMENQILVKENDADLMWRLALRYERNLQFEKAADLWEKIVNSKGTTDKIIFSNALYALGFYYGSIGKYSKAVRFLSLYLEEFPESENIFKARYCLALSYLGLGKKRESIGQLEILNSAEIPDSMKDSIYQLMKKIKES